MKSHRLGDKRHLRLARLAATQGSVVSRRQAYDLDITRWEVRAHVSARRWGLIGDQSIVLHSGTASETGMRWAAVFQGGPRARLDGASALVASGLQRFEVSRIRVSVPRGAKIRRSKQFDIRQTRRWREADATDRGIPRTRPAVAAVHGALWASSNKQATLLLTMTVQQGLATPAQVSEAALAVRKDRRRRLLHAVILDLLGGAQSLGEIDVAKECRRRGFPEPSRQVLRQARGKRYFLDVVWEEWGLVVEIDGIQHSWADHVVGDALRHNAVALSGLTVLRLPLLGLRVAPDDFYEQIEAALRAAGWTPDGG